jgi:hypothetical protein
MTLLRLPWPLTVVAVVALVVALASPAARSASTELSPQAREVVERLEAASPGYAALARQIHYVITNGGKAPNVVPDFAEAANRPRSEGMAHDYLTRK